MSVTPFPIQRERSNALIPVSFTNEFREYAFQVWLYVCDRNAAATARFLADPTSVNTDHLDLPDVPPVEIHFNTVGQWVKNLHWHDRARAEFQTIAPDIWNQTAETILIGARESVTYLRAVANGSQPLTKEDRTRVEASKLLLDRAGFLPWGRGVKDSPNDGPKQDFSGTFAGMETEELAESLWQDVVNRLPKENEDK